MGEFFDQARPFLLVFGGCCLAMIFFEYALQQDPGCSNFLTFTELAFISIESLATRLGKPRAKGSKTSKFALIASKKDHLTHAALWVTMSWLVNYAYSFRIAVPIHTIVRACNVVATLLLGYLFFNTTYSMTQCAAGLLVTIGIIFGTLGDANVVGKCQSASIFGCVGGEFKDSKEVAIWTIGVGILLVCLFMQALLGHVQRRMYDPYLAAGKQKNDVAEEFMFTSSLASLLGSLVFWEEIVKHGKNAAASPKVDIPGMPGTGIPIQFLWVLGNNIAQACCIKGVFYLATRYSPLTVNITLSVRKFTTVIFSVLWFSNPWSSMHSVATLLVFSGGFLYSSGEMLFGGSGKKGGKEDKKKDGGKSPTKKEVEMKKTK